MVVPIKRVIKNKRLLSLLDAQFSDGTELGVEVIDEDNRVVSHTKYRVYTRKDNDDWSRDRFVIQQVRKSGRIREYCLVGDIYFSQ